MLNVFIICGLLSGYCTGQINTIPLSVPTVKIERTDVPPVIDANLADKCWKNSAVIGCFIQTDGYWAREQTEGFITYDEKYLYIAVRCHESQAQSLIVPNKSHDDAAVYSEDCVEIYLDVNLDNNTFYHLIINPGGNIYEAFCDVAKGIRDTSWDPNCITAAAIGRHEWTVELAIPFAGLGVNMPERKIKWGFNLNREQYKKHENSSWAMARSFNDPGQFGRLIFDELGPVSPFLCFAKNSQGESVVRATIRNNKADQIQLNVEASLPDRSRFGKSFKGKIKLGPLTEESLDIPYDMGNDTRTASILAISVTNGQNDEIYLQKNGYLKWLPPVTVIPNLYYYGADCNVIGVQVITEGGNLLHISIKHAHQGKVLADTTSPILPDRNVYNLSIPMNGIGLGRYIVTATVLGKDNLTKFTAHSVIYKTDIIAIKAKPMVFPVRPIVFRDDGVLIINDKPFCPFFTKEPGQVPSLLANNSFNINWGNFGVIPESPVRVSLETQRLVTGNDVVYRLVDEESIEQEIVRKRMSQYLANKSNVFDWFISYEAQIPMYRDQERHIRLDNPQELRKVHDFIKSIDTVHPTNMQIDNFSELALYNNCTDMIEVACWSSSYAKNLIQGLVRDVETIRKILGPSKPVLFYIGSSIPDEYCRTAEEIRCAAYLALMHGMNGLVFHVGHAGIKATSTRHWSVYRGLAREIEFVYPILSSVEQPHLSFIVSSDKAVLDMKVRQCGHKTYVITCNTSSAIITPSFRLIGNGYYSYVNLPLEHRQLGITGNSFNDEFMPYEVHVYEMTATGAS